MATLDASIVNVALPNMADKLGVSSEAIAWTVSAYIITIAGTILIFGRLGDILGKTRIFHIGIIVFTLGSLLCGTAHSFLFLIIARVVQALGASATMATNQGIITQVFPSNERGKALGISGTFVALGSMAGPPIGGFIISYFRWNYIFLINVPIGLFLFIMAMKILPKSEQNRKEKLDARGAILFTLSIVSLFFSLLVGENYGYDNIPILSGFAVSILAFIIFLIFERKTEDPLLQLSLFKNRLFSLSIFCAFISFVAISSTTIIQPFYLQYTMKYSPAFTGILMMVYPLVMSFVAPFSGSLSDKIGSEFLTFVGLVLNSIGLFLMSSLNQFSNIYAMLLYIVIMSAGNGLFQSPNTSLIMSNAPRNMLGISGSVNALIRNLGMITGISLSLLILFGRMSSKIGYNVSNYITGRDEIFVYGMRGAYFTAATICSVGAVLTAFRLYGRRRRSRAET
jgi:EmrB/QacA subfamily drug resistance transporter